MNALAHAFAFQPAPVRRPAFTLLGAAGPAQLPRVTLRELIRLRLGEPDIQEQFLQAWQPIVENEVRRYSALGGPADDLSGEANLALWEAATQYDPQHHRTTPAQYIQNHIHRRVRHAYRESQGYDRPLEVAPLESALGRPDERLIAVEQAADLGRAVAQLQPAEQAQFEQYARLALAGMGPDEAARAMAAGDGATFAAAKKRLERLRKKVREHLSR
ncbi:MAG TPA: sigma-70 family RNA polymerase sigma factor [Symbiobacteriaceae bacterium]|nr:sigma-70 family RNA polymerase sigma factor [Symbiobacteriaceae bacterium]